MNVIDFANQVLDMQDEIVRLNREVTRLMKIEEDYHRLVAADIEHGQKMVGGIMALLLDDRIKLDVSNGTAKR